MPSVIRVEGLRSYKAIAFITSKSNRRRNRLKTKLLLDNAQTLRKRFFKRAYFFVWKPRSLVLQQNLGDEKWKK
jgi:hypothetical protein